jgi:hypothetical protein
MARPKKVAPASYSPSQAVYVLERALADRKLSRADVKHYIGGMTEEIAALERRLASLRDALAEPVKRLVHKIEVKVRGGDEKQKARKKRAVSPEVAATRKLQGQYLGFISQIPKTKRAPYQKIAKTKGREEAIAAIRKTLGK